MCQVNRSDHKWTISVTLHHDYHETDYWPTPSNYEESVWKLPILSIIEHTTGFVKHTENMPQNPNLISFEYVVKNSEQEFINGVPVMTHPTVNGNVKSNNPRPGYQVFRPSSQQQENLEIWLHGPR